MVQALAQRWIFGHALARLVWAVLAAIHAPLLVTSTLRLARGDADASAVACGVLLITFGFFALKALDVPWLRLGSPRRMLLVMTIVSGIAHHEIVVEHATPEQATVATFVLGTVGLTGAVRRRRHRGDRHGICDELVALARALRVRIESCLERLGQRVLDVVRLERERWRRRHTSAPNVRSRIVTPVPPRAPPRCAARLVAC